MGILNVTPDSFSDAGQHMNCNAAIRRAVEMVREGVDVIDVGGESTRPGSQPVSASDQIDRVVPAIRGMRAAGIGLPISIDTQSAEVAAAALAAGADIVNDVSGVRTIRTSQDSSNRDIPTDLDNRAMMALLASRDVPFVIMHMLGSPDTMQSAPKYADVVQDVRAFFHNRAKAMESTGVQTEGRMIVDPGIGFGKQLEHNLSLIRVCASFSQAWPVLLGTSRKRLIGEMLTDVAGHEGAPDARHRVMGTAATIAHAALTGVDMVRVHDVQAMREVVEVCWRLSDE